MGVQVREGGAQKIKVVEQNQAHNVKLSDGTAGQVRCIPAMMSHNADVDDWLTELSLAHLVPLLLHSICGGLPVLSLWNAGVRKR